MVDRRDTKINVTFTLINSLFHLHLAGPWKIGTIFGKVGPYLSRPRSPRKFFAWTDQETLHYEAWNRFNISALQGRDTIPTAIFCAVFTREMCGFFRLTCW